MISIATNEQNLQNKQFPSQATLSTGNPSYTVNHDLLEYACHQQRKTIFGRG
jgi:hypothetical protein